MTAKKPRPKTLTGKTYKIKTGCGNMFVTLNEDESGIFELFIRFGKGGGCSSTIGESVGRLVSLAFRTGGTVDEIVKQLAGITCHQQRGATEDDPAVLSCIDALATVLRDRTKKEK